MAIGRHTTELQQLPKTWELQIVNARHGRFCSGNNYKQHSCQCCTNCRWWSNAAFHGLVRSRLPSTSAKFIGDTGLQHRVGLQHASKIVHSIPCEENLI